MSSTTKDNRKIKISFEGQSKRFPLFSTLLLTHYKLKFDNDKDNDKKDFPNFLQIAIDLFSEVIFLSYTNTIEPMTQAAFISYIKDNIKENGLDEEKCTFVSNSSTIEITKKIKKRSNLLHKEIGMQINKIIKNTNLSLLDLLSKTYSYIMYYNLFKVKISLGNKTSKDFLISNNVSNKIKLFFVPPIFISIYLKDIQENRVTVQKEIHKDTIVEIKNRTIELLENEKDTFVNSNYKHYSDYLVLLEKLLLINKTNDKDKNLEIILLKDKYKLLKILGQWDSAESNYKKILKDFDKDFNTLEKDKIDILLEYAYLLEDKMEFDKALKKVKLALNLSNKKDYDVHKFRVFIQFISIYLQLGNLKRAESYIKKVILLSNTSKIKKDDFYFSKLYNILSDYYYNQGNYEKALKETIKYVRLAKKIGNKERIYIGYVNLSIFYESTGDYIKSHKYGLKQLDIAKKENSDMKLIESYGSLGNLSNVTEDFKQASIYFKRELSLSKKVNYAFGKIQSITGIIVAGIESNRIGYLENYCFDLIELAKENDRDSTLANGYFFLADIYCKKSRVSKSKLKLANQYLIKAKKIFLELKSIQMLEETEKLFIKLSKFK